MKQQIPSLPSGWQIGLFPDSEVYVSIGPTVGPLPQARHALTRGPRMRHCLALDLHDDPNLIAQYEAHHRDVWPEVLAHLRAHGVRELEIFRLGTRLVMMMDTDDAT